MVVVIEDDVIKRIGDKEDIDYVYGKACHWIMSEFRKITEALIDLLPQKCKKEDHPYILWIPATRHDSYKNDSKRMKFNNNLSAVGKLHANNFVLELKQIWDPTEKSLFSTAEGRMSAHGIHTFWKSFDRTVKFCTSIIDRVAAKKY